MPIAVVGGGSPTIGKPVKGTADGEVLHVDSSGLLQSLDGSSISGSDLTLGGALTTSIDSLERFKVADVGAVTQVNMGAGSWATHSTTIGLHAGYGTLNFAAGANDFEIRAFQALDFQTNGTTTALTLDTSQKAVFSGDVNATDCFFADQSAGKVYIGTNSVNSSSGPVLKNNEITGQEGDTAFLQISGGDGGGGRVVLYGTSHATQAGDVLIYTGGASPTLTLTLDGATQDATFASNLGIGAVPSYPLHVTTSDVTGAVIESDSVSGCVVIAEATSNLADARPFFRTKKDQAPSTSTLGGLEFNAKPAAGGPGYNYAYIYAVADGTSVSNNLPSRLEFATSSTSSGTTPVVALTLDSSQNATFAGVLYLPDGTAAAPSISFTSDDDTGFYRKEINTVSFAAQGARRFDMDTTGIRGILNGGPEILTGTVASGTVPVFVFRSDTDTGMGHSAANYLELITGGVTALVLDDSQNATFAGNLTVTTSAGFELYFDGVNSANIAAESGNTFYLGTEDAQNLALYAGGVTSRGLVVGPNGGVVTQTSVLDDATGDEAALTVNFTVNKATSGNDTGLLINKTDTASPGLSYLIDAQLAGGTKFAVLDNGQTVTGGSTFGPNAGSLKVHTIGNYALNVEGNILHENTSSTNIGYIASANLLSGGAATDYSVVSVNNLYLDADAGELYLLTSNTTALTIDSSQNATFAGNIEYAGSGLLNSSGSSMSIAVASTTRLAYDSDGWYFLPASGKVGINVDPASSGAALQVGQTLSAATGDEVFVNLNYTVNKATSGDDTGLLINRTDTASPGTSSLVDFQNNGSSFYRLDPQTGGNFSHLWTSSGLMTGNAGNDVQLSVRAEASTGRDARITISRQSTGRTAEVQFETAGTDDWGIRTPETGNQDDLVFHSYTLAADVLTLADTGDVGINCSSPAEKLHIVNQTGNAAHMRLSDPDSSSTANATGYIEVWHGENTSRAGYFGMITSAEMALATTTATGRIGLYTGAGVKAVAIDSSLNTTFNGTVYLKERSAAVADVAAHGQLWVKDDTPNVLYFTDDAGTDHNLIGGGTSLEDATSPFTTVNTAASPYTVVSGDYILLGDATSGNITINLPAAASSTGRTLIIKKTDSSSNTVTVDGSGAETIDGGATAALATQYESITIACDGTEWWII